jgi:deoxycytidylate deaminase
MSGMKVIHNVVEVESAKEVTTRTNMTGAYVPQSLLNQKEVISTGRNKSMNFPSYYKGGSVANERR